MLCFCSLLVREHDIKESVCLLKFLGRKERACPGPSNFCGQSLPLRHTCAWANFPFGPSFSLYPWAKLLTLCLAAKKSRENLERDLEISFHPSLLRKARMLNGLSVVYGPCLLSPRILSQSRSCFSFLRKIK